MKILVNYLYTHWWSLSFLCAFVFFSMDMSGIIGNWGYMAYYPVLFILSFYCIKRNKKINYLYVAYLTVCFLSAIVNDIPSYFNIPMRLGVFVLLLCSFSSLLNSREIALLRLHLFHIFSILSVVLVSINYVLFSFGMGDNRQMEVFEEQGLYTGSTANNEMGLLGAIAIMYIVVFAGKYYKHFNLIEKILLLFALICSISMMGMASSRMALMCTLVSVIIVLLRMNRKKFFKLILTGVIFIAGLFAVSNILGDKFRFMLSKNGGNTEMIDTHSRDELWEGRVREYRENPILGCGFAYMKYGWGSLGAKDNKGRIETGSGWLSVLSQTGTAGAFCLFFIVVPNVIYLIRRRSDSYCYLWILGMCIMFLLQPITEAYITTVGAVLCCLFWLNYSVIDSFRKGILKEEDLDLSIYSEYKWFDKRLKRLNIK